MAIVRFKDLCIDAVEPDVVGRFWGAVLGLDVRHHRSGVVGLWRGETTVIWVNPGAGPKTVKNRVHADLRAWSRDRIAELGATVIADTGGWTVMGDPEGNEFCVFPALEAQGDDDPVAHLFAVCVDSADPEPLAAWWAELTEAEIGPGSDWMRRWLHGAAGLEGTILKFVRVDDERQAKNRVHWDVHGDVADLVAAGATVVREPDDVIDWTVMHDPQGNVFCVFP